ncbi:hypothetical protein GCM10011428_48000 [Streptomyces violaceus]
MLLQARSGAEELTHPAGQVSHLVPEQALVEAFSGEDTEVRLHTGADHEEVTAVDFDHREAQLPGVLGELLGDRLGEGLQAGHHGGEAVDVVGSSAP